MDKRREGTETDKRRRARRRRRLLGRHGITLGALALGGLSGYELWIRVEDFWAWTSGIRHLSQVRGTPFFEDLSIVFEAPEMRALGFKMLFCACAVIFALACLVCRNRRKAPWAIMPLDLALVGSGAYLGLYSLRPSDWAQGLKLAPLALILVGCVVNLVHARVLARRRRNRKARRAPEPERRMAA